MRSVYPLGIGLAALLLLSGSASAIPRAVTLTARPVKSSFALGETVTIELEIKNTGRTPVAISDLFDGNFALRRLTVDGQAVPTRTTVALYDEELAVVSRQGLKEILPNQSRTVLWSSVPDTPLGGEALYTVRAAKASPQETRFSLGQPGTYAFSIAYRYHGETIGNKAVFLGTTNYAPVSFTITPPP